MIQLTKFLNENGSSFTVNIYPFINLYIDSNFSMQYAFFDGNATLVNDGDTNYTNMFDANYNTLVWAIQKNGFTNMGIIVGEFGCPSYGDRNANNQLAQRFMQGFCEMPLIQREGTNFLPPARIFIAKTLWYDVPHCLPLSFSQIHVLIDSNTQSIPLFSFDLKFKWVSVNVVPFFIINLICNC
ncbi:unnamed protein product [Lactuca saligna]|uniref:Glucan endo-1,3-beta-D-glucosidase n=1 Tax=Lactuca saligna TaxID=75948 RepID=A0AA35YPJ6_LACSI|nr:unnamed protein product [Lactuca saligna]